MPKKSTRHVREPGLTRSSHHRSNPGTGPGPGSAAVAGTGTNLKAKHFRSVRIGLTNGKRWLSLKKRLGLSTDEDVAVYLLDLAESASRHGDKYNGREEGKVERDKRDKTETIQAENPIEYAGEPLRRSLRKQSGAISPDPKVPSVDTTRTDSRSDVLNDVELHTRRSSKPKHHKNKAKHHKDKRKKRKHLRVVNAVSSTTESIDRDSADVASSDERKISVERTDSGLASEVDTKSNLDDEKFGVTTKEVDSITTKTEDLGNIEFVESVHTNKEEIIASCHDAKDINPSSVDKLSIKYNKSLQSRLDHSQTSLSGENMIDDIVNENLPLTMNDQVSVDDSQDQSAQLRHDEHTALSERCIGSSIYSDRILNISKVNVDPTKEVEDRKVKKKRKRPRYTVDEDEEEENAVEDSSEDFFEETVQKHKRKKHKHNSEHKNRKHHDVRKAPQDGIVVREDVRETRSVTNDPSGIPEERLQPQGEIGLENLMSEPQRLAIKIKLCQDCNSRHLQDACPLTTPQYTITDSISYDNWLNKHSENLEVINAMRSDDPMSEGYGKVQEDNYESDEESLPTEHCKTKSKAHYEEKQLIVDVNRPLYARDSLPDCFELKITNSEHGLGIYAKDSVPMYVKLGPLVGKPVREMDIPDDFSMRHIWEVDENNGKTSYISTTNPLKSNWIRYIRPAETKEERSVAVITKQGELHLVTTQNIVSGMELTYWQDSQSSAWTRKNKVDKTNCGGCNLNFAHPIYYRLHCCIFHDTNYSLTIRKYHCKVCGAAVLGKDNIMKHAAELHAGRGAYQCQYCKKFFLRLNYLEMHRTYGCAQNPQRSRPLCDYCGRKFCQPQKLKVHIKRMHSDMSEVLREFQCKLCLKLLGSRAALQRHMKEVHHKDVVGAATCDRCGKMFQNKSNLKIHMLTHSGVKPFKCKENGCKAAFTTKQCLQFHYKKVHGLTEDMMPKIERSVAYTFDAYSGGLVEDVGRGKTPRPSRRSSQQDNSNSLPSLDECSSESSLKVETPNNSVHPSIIEFQAGPNSSVKYKTEHDSHISTPSLSVGGSVPNTFESAMVENVRTEVDLYSASRLQSKGSKKWLGEFNPPVTSDVTANTISHLTTNSVTNNVYEFEESRKESDEKTSPSNTRTQSMLESSKLGLSVYRRTESANASLLVEAALDAAERDIGAVSSPILEDNDRDTNLYSISSQLQSPIPQRSPTHLDSYIQQQEELISPAPTPDGRHSPPTHLHVDYQLHRPVDYISTPRTHNIDQYLHHEEMPRVSSPNNYIHIQQDDLVSPSVTPNPRYQDTAMHHHHQVPTDNLSSDEGDSVAQNLSLSVKEKALQLDLSTSYKYDPLEQDFVRERSNFEPLVLNTGELQGLDMSARGFHHGFGVQVQNARYHHHHHHLYEIAERQTVDLSRTGGYSISPPLTSVTAQAPPSSTSAQPTVGSSLPPLTSAVTAVSAASGSTVPPPPYPHSDVLRVVSLDLTPGGRHTVDLTLSRAHHLHGSGARVITSPQSAGSANLHIVPDTVEGRILSPPPPPPPLSGYNPSYPVSPAPYHPPRPGYHHYSGYY